MIRVAIIGGRFLLLRGSFSRAPAPAPPGAPDFANPLHVARRPTLMLQRLPPTLRLHVELFQKGANALLDLVSDGSYCMQRLAGGVG